ncbi:MAG TPA: Yip1 family protein [Gemmatimonadaceae bacterium]|jgi:hypothetical protein
MTDSTAGAVPPASTSFWEDLIDIFFQPAAVFRRRATKSVWPPMLFVAIAVGVIFAATFNTIEPAFDAEFSRGMALAMSKNPQMTADMASKARGFAELTARFGAGLITFISIFVIGCVTWVVAKLVGAKQTFNAALVVAAWSYMPRVVGAVLTAVEGLIMDPQSFTGMMSLSFSPARFMDPVKSNQLLYQLAGRFDLFTIWVTVLLAIGVYVTGKVSKDRAVIFGILMWVLGSLPALRQGFMAM